jgi:hypothetical protein
MLSAIASMMFGGVMHVHTYEWSGWDLREAFKRNPLEWDGAKWVKSLEGSSRHFAGLKNGDMDMGFDFGAAAVTKPGTNRKPYFEPDIEATCVVQMAKLIEGGGANGTSNSYVFEFRVVSAKPTVQGAITPSLNDERAYVVNLNSEYAAKNLNSLAIALAGREMPGLSEEQKKALVVEGATIEQVMAKDRAAKGSALQAFLNESEGLLVKVRTKGILTKGKGNPFTVMDWTHVPGQSLETVSANRKKLASGASL